MIMCDRTVVFLHQQRVAERVPFTFLKTAFKEEQLQQESTPTPSTPLVKSFDRAQNLKYETTPLALSAQEPLQGEGGLFLEKFPS